MFANCEVRLRNQGGTVHRLETSSSPIRRGDPLWRAALRGADYSTRPVPQIRCRHGRRHLRDGQISATFGAESGRNDRQCSELLLQLLSRRECQMPAPIDAGLTPAGAGFVVHVLRIRARQASVDPRGREAPRIETQTERGDLPGAGGAHAHTGGNSAQGRICCRFSCIGLSG